MEVRKDCTVVNQQEKIILEWFTVRRYTTAVNNQTTAYSFTVIFNWYNYQTANSGCVIVHLLLKPVLGKPN